MEDLAEIILSIHIGTAIVTVFAGTVSVIARKSQFVHRTYGKMFLYSMIITALTAFMIMYFPGHENIMMLLIGLFNLYLAVSGYRSLGYKTVFKKSDFKAIDKLITMSMIFIGLVMAYQGSKMLSEGDNWGLVLVIYSFIGFINVFEDFRLYKTIQNRPFAWIKFHAAKMIGSYIGAMTAVFVTQLSDNSLGLVAWFIPCALGLGYIAYWTQKIKKEPQSIFEWN